MFKRKSEITQSSAKGNWAGLGHGWSGKQARSRLNCIEDFLFILPKEDGRAGEGKQAKTISILLKITTEDAFKLCQNSEAGPEAGRSYSQLPVESAAGCA